MTFTDGTARDVTTIAVYETANPIVKISDGGLVDSDHFGETTVLVRFLNKQIPVRLAFCRRDRISYGPSRPNNYID